MNAYKSYRNLPPLAGVCSMPDAMKPGFSVEECVRMLRSRGLDPLRFEYTRIAPSY